MAFHGHNVAAQNHAAFDRVVGLTVGLRRRTAGYPAACYRLLADRGVDVDRSVLVIASTAEQGINPIAGLLLTQDGRFIEFDVDCDRSGERVDTVLAWADVTAAQNCSDRNAAFGKDTGAIAFEVQRRLG